MKVKWIRNGKEYWITNFVTKVDWSGANTQASRTLVFCMINSPYDSAMTVPDVKMGDEIVFYGDTGKARFHGKVTGRERRSEIGEREFTARDFMHNLIKSKESYKFRKKTPEYITRAVCKDLGIQVGTLAKTKKKLEKYMPANTSVYNIILAAYNKVAAKTKKKYGLMMNGKKLCVVETGKIIKGYVLDGQSKLTAAEYTENIDGMVNEVAVYNKNGKKVGVVKNAKWLKAYGPYQESITGTKKAKKMRAADKKSAQGKLKGADKTAQVEAIGNEDCVAGRGLVIYDKASGLNATYWIKSDTHTWENGIHTMQLELAFKNVQEKVSVSGWPKKSKKSGSKKAKADGSYSGGGGKLGWPCRGTITSEFGPRTGFGSSYHQGLDIAVPTGTKIHAAAGGKVTCAGWSGGYGKLVIINHGGGLKTYYGHNSSISVRVGQKVKRGSVIAHAGSTGQSSGSHCHFGVLVHGSFRNPRKYLK